MKKVVKEVQLEEAQMNELERAFYEYDMFKDNMSFLIMRTADDVNFFESTAYKNMHDKEMEVYKNFLAVRDHITQTYIPEEFRDSKYIWEADFDNKKLVIRG